MAVAEAAEPVVATATQILLLAAEAEAAAVGGKTKPLLQDKLGKLKLGWVAMAARHLGTVEETAAKVERKATYKTQAIQILSIPETVAAEELAVKTALGRTQQTLEAAVEPVELGTAELEARVQIMVRHPLTDIRVLILAL